MLPQGYSFSTSEHQKTSFLFPREPEKPISVPADKDMIGHQLAVNFKKLPPSIDP